MYFGWSCMSWRHEVTPSTSSAAPQSFTTVGTVDAGEESFLYQTRSLHCVHSVLCGGELTLVRNGRHLSRIQRFQKSPGALWIELRVFRFDAEKKSIAAREGEARDV